MPSLSTLDSELPEHVWYRSGRDRRVHAVLVEDVARSRQGYLDAVCTHVLSIASAARMDGPDESACPMCLCATGPKVGDQRANPPAR